MVGHRTAELERLCGIARCCASISRVPAPFVHRLRVRYSECDAQGIVFNANHFAYFDLVLTELWRAAFGSYQALLDAEADLVVAEASASFRAPARFDDERREEG